MKNRVAAFIVCIIVGMLLVVACSNNIPPTVLPPVIIATSTKQNPFGTLIALTPTSSPLPTTTPIKAPTIAPSKSTGRIAFDALLDDCTSGNGDIWVADADGTGVTKLTQESFYGGEAVYYGLTILSPDGSRIIVTQGKNPNVEYYRVYAQ